MFGFNKKPANCPLGVNKDSHHLDCVNFSHPQVTILIVEIDIVEDVHIQQLPFGSTNLLPLVS
jgi:hypothetical protein